jgi:hypothetical protein
VAPDFVELQDPQCLVRAVILKESLETLCGREVFERQRALATIVTPNDSVGLPSPILLGVDACHSS